MEAEILREVLRENSIEPVDAGESFTPGQLAFCTKICSKIITSQFCAILLNNEKKDGIEVANPNVQMEYGLMLGFNKYVIPLQQEGDALSFNISGLDTLKYRKQDFRRLATDAIKQADAQTRPEKLDEVSIDSLVESFILSKRRLVVPLTTDGDRNLFELGRPLGYALLADFSGLNYSYFGNFAHLDPGQICWRVQILSDILNERRRSVPQRVSLDLIDIDPGQMAAFDAFFDRLTVWLLVASPEAAEQVQQAIKPVQYRLEINTLDDVWNAVQQFGRPS